MRLRPRLPHDFGNAQSLGTCDQPLLTLDPCVPIIPTSLWLLLSRSIVFAPIVCPKTCFVINAFAFLTCRRRLARVSLALLLPSPPARLLYANLNKFYKMTPFVAACSINPNTPRPIVVARCLPACQAHVCACACELV